MKPSSPHRRTAAFAACLSAITVLTACGTSGTGSESSKVQVTASFYPLEFIATEIAGDHAEVKNLTAPGVEPHDLELTPQQAIQLNGTDLAFYEKGLAPAVDKAIANDAPENVLDVTEAITLLQTSEHDHDEADHDEADHDEAGDGHDHGATDPHFWHDPELMRQVAEKFTADISAIDPEHKADYQANLETLNTTLSALDEEFRTGLANCQIRTVVTSHDAFEYLGQRYDLTFEPIAGISPDATPSTQYLHQLSELIKDDKITTVFSEELSSPKQAETLADDLGIKTAVLNPIEGPGEGGKADYVDLMRANLNAIQQANTCQ